MKYLNKTIAYGLYLLVFLLPLGTRWIIKAGQLNYGPWEYGTYSLYGTDILLLIILALSVAVIASDRRERSNLTNKDVEMRLPRRPEYGAPRNDNSVFNQRLMCFNGRMTWWFIGGLVLVSAVSVFGAVDRLLALYKFGWLILGLGLFWLVASANYDRLKLIYAMFAGAFLSAGLGIWQFLSQATLANKWLGLALHRSVDLGTSVIETVGADGIGERWLRAYGSLDHPNIFGGLIAIGLLFLIGEIITGKMFKNFQFSIFNFQIIFNNKIFKYVNWFLLLVFTAGLFFSFSRSAWLALAVGLILMAALAVGRGNLKWQKGLAEIILVMGILSLIIFSQYQNLVVSRLSSQGRLENKSNSERLVSFKESWQIAKEHWLIGVGPGNYTLALSRELPGQGSYYYQPAHNVFLLVWAEIGIGGLLLFLGLLFVMARIILFLSSSGERQRDPGIQESEERNNLDSLPVRQAGRLRGNDKWGSGNDRKDCRRDNQGLAILSCLIILMLFDHWLFSLHFGVLFFWLVLGIMSRNSQRVTHNA